MIASRDGPAQEGEQLKEAGEEAGQKEDSMKSLLSTVLTGLNRIQSLEETTMYLQSEWLASENDLKIAMQDEATWNALKLPTRLKLAIKSEISRKESAAAAAAAQKKKKEERLSNSIPAPIDLESFTTPRSKQGDNADISLVQEECRNPSMSEDTNRLTTARTTRSIPKVELEIEIEQKASEIDSGIPKEHEYGVGEATYEEYEQYEQSETYGEEKGLLQTIGDDDDDGFREQVNQMWVKSYSPEHRSVYYFNEVTDETTWDLPEGVEASREDEWAASSWADSDEHEAAAEGEGENIAERRSPASTLSPRSPLPMPPGPAPTAYTRPAAPPSAPAMPAELVEAFQAEPVSVEATPVNSPDQRVSAYPVLVDGEVSSSDVETEEDEDREDAESGQGAFTSPRGVAVDDDESDDEELDDADEFSSGGDEDVVVDPDNLQTLMDMGFGEQFAARALQKAHNDMQMATIACLRQEEASLSPSAATAVVDRDYRHSPSVDTRATAVATRSVSAETGTEAMTQASPMAQQPRRPLSAGKRLPLMSRISRSINRAMSGANKAKKHGEDMGIALDD